MGRFAPEYSAIGTSESGSGSHQRRKDRVNTLFSSGCGMPANVAEFRAQCTGVMDLADALPEICVSGLWEHAKKFVGRGSWCVDLTEECPVCLGRPGPGKSWSTIFHCQHRACSECLDDVLKEKQDCMVCRGVIDSDLLAVTVVAEEKVQDSAEVVEQNKRCLGEVDARIGELMVQLKSPYLKS